MSNERMISVKSSVLEKALRDAGLVRFHTDSHVAELRALLDAPAKTAPSCVGELERFESDGEDFVKVGDVIDMLGNLKAAQPQGEPIYQLEYLGEDVTDGSRR